MELIADFLLGAGALGAGLFCYVLARRLRRFSTLESELGGAIAVLSGQVDDMTRALAAARSAANESTLHLTELTERAEKSARDLEILIATLHDLPSPAEGVTRRKRVVHNQSRARMSAEFSTSRQAEEAA